MPIVRTYRCPDCNVEFDHFFARSDEKPPNYCPNCGAFVGDEEALPARPNIQAGIARRSGDAVQRAMEDAGAARAELASAASPGSQRSDFSGLKGDMTRPLTAEQAALADRARSLSFGQAGAEFAAGVRQGPYPNAGNAARAAITGKHGQVARAVERAGQIGRAKR